MPNITNVPKDIPSSDGFSNIENFDGAGAPVYSNQHTPAPNQPKQTPPDQLSEFTAGDYTWEQF